jgi:cytochrome P450
VTSTEDYQVDLLDPTLMADPHGVFGKLRDQAPLWRGRTMAGEPVWYVMGSPEVRAVLADNRFVVTPVLPAPGTENVRAQLLAGMGVPPELAKYLQDLLPDAEGAEHTRLRKLVSRAFTVRRVSEMRSRVEEITSALLDDIEAAGPGPVDLLKMFAYPLPSTVISELIGVPEADRAAWQEWADVLAVLDQEKYAAALGGMVGKIEELVRRHRAEPADDLMSSLLQVHTEDGDRLSEEELVKLLITLVNTGYETTAHLIGNGVAALLRHPEQLAMLRRDPGLWPLAVHELVRLWVPVRVTAVRYATEPMELAGVRIEAGEAVQPVLISANTDPRQCPHPEQLDITRHEERGESHLGFGYGVHYCLGAPLARQTAEVGLAALFRRFPDLALASEPEWIPNPLMVLQANLPVYPHPGK